MTSAFNVPMTQKTVWCLAISTQFTAVYRQTNNRNAIAYVVYTALCIASCGKITMRITVEISCRSVGCPLQHRILQTRLREKFNITFDTLIPAATGFCWSEKSVLLPRDAMHKRGLRHHAVSVSVYVCPSVTFVDYIKTSNRIVKIFTTE